MMDEDGCFLTVLATAAIGGLGAILFISYLSNNKKEEPVAQIETLASNDCRRGVIHYSGEILPIMPTQTNDSSAVSTVVTNKLEVMIKDVRSANIPSRYGQNSSTLVPITLVHATDLEGRNYDLVDPNISFIRKGQRAEVTYIVMKDGIPIKELIKRNTLADEYGLDDQTSEHDRKMKGQGVILNIKYKEGLD